MLLAEDPQSGTDVPVQVMVKEEDLDPQPLARRPPADGHKVTRARLIEPNTKALTSHDITTLTARGSIQD